MPASIAIAPTGRSRVGQSIFAVAAAIVANAAGSLAVDQLLHALDVYPPWGEPMHDAGLNLLALSYRVAFGIGSGYLVARLAPQNPRRHAAILGVIGTVLGTIGAVVALTQADLGPAWYPIALAALAYPTVRLGAAWQQHLVRIQ
jgi:hypothetical protein